MYSVPVRLHALQGVHEGFHGDETGDIAHRIRMRRIYDQRDLLLLDLLLHLCFVQSSGVDMKILPFF